MSEKPDWKHDTPPVSRDGMPVDPIIEHQPSPVESLAALEKVRPLTPVELRRLGTIVSDIKPTTSQEQANIDAHLHAQALAYEEMDKEELIAELTRRDKNEIHLGKDVAEGKLQQRFLKEFIRGCLMTLEAGELGRLVASKTPPAEKLLQAFGFDPDGQRDLRVNVGTMLGSLDDRTPEEAITSPLIPQQPSQKAADDIRAAQERKHPIVESPVGTLAEIRSVADEPDHHHDSDHGSSATRGSEGHHGN